MATTEQRLKEYEKLYKQAQTYDPNKFQGDFQKAYGEATNYNQDLINQQAQSLGELQAVAPTLREQYSNSLITDPTKQMALIAQARQAPITNWATAAGLLEARGNKYSDILAKALGGYQTSAQQANTAAENAWRLYQDAVQQDQFNRSQGGGGGGINLKDLLKDSDGDGIPDFMDKTPFGEQKGNLPAQTTTPYWQSLTKAAQWQPENDALANIYNRLTNTVGKFVYENTNPVSWIKNLFNRNR